MYRIYLRSPDQQVSDKTNTGDRAAALAAFTTLVNRIDLDGSKLMAVLNQDGRPIAYHRFDARADDATHYWRGRLDSIPWPR